MEEIKTEQQFKKALLECVKYMAHVCEASSLEMDIDTVTISLSVRARKEEKK